MQKRKKKLNQYFSVRRRGQTYGIYFSKHIQELKFAKIRIVYENLPKYVIPHGTIPFLHL